MFDRWPECPGEGHVDEVGRPPKAVSQVRKPAGALPPTFTNRPLMRLRGHGLILPVPWCPAVSHAHRVDVPYTCRHILARAAAKRPHLNRSALFESGALAAR